MLLIHLLQIWTDYRLSWNVSEFDNLSVIYVLPTDIWTPDIGLFNKLASL